MAAEIEEELIGDLNYEYDDLDINEEEEEALLAEDEDQVLLAEDEDQEDAEEILQEDEEEEDHEIIECHDKHDLSELVIDEELKQVEDDEDEESGNEESGNEGRNRFRNERTNLSLTSERKNEMQIPDSLDKVPVQNVNRKGNFNRRGGRIRRGLYSHGGNSFGGTQRPLMNQQHRPPLAAIGRYPWQMAQDNIMQHRMVRPNMMPLQMRGHRPPMRMGFPVVPRSINPNYIAPYRSPWGHTSQLPPEYNHPQLNQNYGRPQLPPNYEGTYFDFTSDVTMNVPQKRTMQPVTINDKEKCIKGMETNIQQNVNPIAHENNRGPVKSRLSHPNIDKKHAQNPNLKTVQVVDIKKPEENDVPVIEKEVNVNDDQKYLKELEEQKKKREQFLRAKEIRRQATIAKAVQEVKTTPTETVKMTEQIKENRAKVVANQATKSNVSVRSKISIPPQANVKPRIVNTSQNIYNTRPQSRPILQKPASSYGPKKYINRPQLRMPHPQSTLIQTTPHFKAPPPVRAFVQEPTLLRPNYYQSQETQQFITPTFNTPRQPFNTPPRQSFNTPPRQSFNTPPRQSFNTPPPTFPGSDSSQSHLISTSNFTVPPPIHSLRQSPILPDTSVPPPTSQYQFQPYEHEMNYVQSIVEDSTNEEQCYEENQYYSDDQYFNQEVDEVSAPYESNAYQMQFSEEPSKQMNYHTRNNTDLRSRLRNKKPQAAQKIQVLSSPSHNQPSKHFVQKKTLIPATVKKSVVKKYRKITNKRNGEVVSIVLVPIDDNGVITGDKIVKYKKDDDSSTNELSHNNVRHTAVASNRVPIVNRMREIVHKSRPVNLTKLVQPQTSDFTPISETNVRSNFYLRDLTKQKRKLPSEPDDDLLNSQRQIVRLVKRPKKRYAPIGTLISGKILSECEVQLSNLPAGTIVDDIWDAVSQANVNSPGNVEFNVEGNSCSLSYFSLDQARQMVSFISGNGINGCDVRAAIMKLSS